ncbi:SPASM domain-containing protein [bacterium]|nr:SPASM domain-containing protein [bacterium]
MDGVDIPSFRIKWKDLAGKPYIWHVVERLKRCKRIDEVILVTQHTPENKEVIKLAQEWGLNLRCSDPPQNWDTWLKAQNSLNADIVVWDATPLTDPAILDSMIDYFIAKDLDYLDTPVILIYKTKICSRLYELGKDESDNPGIWTRIVKERGDLFKSDTFGELKEVKFLGQNPLKWYPLLRKIYGRFYKPGETISLDEILSFYEREPEWFEVLQQEQIEIEVTNDCPLKCIMCPRTSNMNRETDYMDFDLFKKIVDKTDASSIHFSGFGEPLLHPKIKEMFVYAKEKRLEVGLWTSGLNLGEDLSREIIEKELLDYIIFSLDAATKETYLKVKGVDAFDKVVGNITRFLSLKKELLKDKPKTYGAWKPLVGVQIIKMKETDKEIEPFMNKWDFQDKAKKVINYRNRVEKEPGKVTAELWQTLYDKFLPVEHAIIGHFNNFCGQIEDRSAIDVTPLKRFPCRQLKEGTSILWNGDVVLCRQDFDGKYPLGNLRDQSMGEILEREKPKEIWQAHKDGRYGKFPLCADCKEWYYNLYG